jgi:hypothetical protein
LEKLNTECRQQILENENNQLKMKRVEILSEFIKMKAFDMRAKIPETVIDYYVDKIIFDHGVFNWYLNPVLGNQTFNPDTTDWKKTAAERFR